MISDFEINFQIAGIVSLILRHDPLVRLENFPKKLTFVTP